MFHGRIDCRRATRIPTGPAQTRRRRGSLNWHSGVSAEESVARRYQDSGATVRHRRLRTPEGEIDLVAEQDGQIVFVEVKRCRPGAEPPLTRGQWRRLENAALSYMVRLQNETGVQPVCRFDVALAGPDGQIRIIENARGFDEH